MRRSDASLVISQVWGAAYFVQRGFVFWSIALAAMWFVVYLIEEYGRD